MAQATWRKEAWLGEPPHRLTWPNLPPTLKDKPKSKREGLRPQANLGLGGWSLCPQSGRFPIFLPFPASHRKFERTKTQYSLLLLNPTTPQIQPLWLLQTRAWGCAPARAAVGPPRPEALVRGRRRRARTRAATLPGPSPTTTANADVTWFSKSPPGSMPTGSLASPSSPQAPSSAAEKARFHAGPCFLESPRPPKFPPGSLLLGLKLDGLSSQEDGPEFSSVKSS